MNNLPPGVSDSDIPGNRPEDREWEEFHEWIDKIATEQGYTPQKFKEVIIASTLLDKVTHFVEATHWDKT